MHSTLKKPLRPCAQALLLKSNFQEFVRSAFREERETRHGKII